MHHLFSNAEVVAAFRDPAALRAEGLREVGRGQAIRGPRCYGNLLELVARTTIVWQGVALHERRMTDLYEAWAVAERGRYGRANRDLWHTDGSWRAEGCTRPDTGAGWDYALLGEGLSEDEAQDLARDWTARAVAATRAEQPARAHLMDPRIVAPWLQAARARIDAYDRERGLPESERRTLFVEEKGRRRYVLLEIGTRRGPRQPYGFIDSRTGDLLTAGPGIVPGQLSMGKVSDAASLAAVGSQGFIRAASRQIRA